MKGYYCSLNPLELLVLFQPRQRLELLIYHSDSAQARNIVLTLPAQVEVIDPNQMVLTLTESGSVKPEFLTPGKVISLILGQTHGSYSFKTRISAYNPTRRRLTLEPPRVMWSQDRRNHPRFPVALPATYRLLRFNNQRLENLSGKIGTGSTDNLSCDGISLVTELQLPVDLTLLIRLEFKEQPVSAVGVVCRTTAIPTHRKLYSVGIKFVMSSPRFQASLLQMLQHNTEFFSKRVLL
ncbi:MAG TPA: PilZ domain-containing protein [Bacillota bacterium]|nr:PilZ domain-containing protein [Bacillota bacterium]